MTLQSRNSHHGLIRRAMINGSLLAMLAAAVGGCAKREKVLDVKTPGGSVEVEKSTYPNGDVEIKVDTEK
ncbi:hypothetical protein SH661x_003267 [Planctomicrobium sp. SH661]|uniref:hypothetical protein n=1 Tax=Planctomicrobium sp. SH661 TaxID=3448124 RepID=UPI003F5C180F